MFAMNIFNSIKLATPRKDFEFQRMTKLTILILLAMLTICICLLDFKMQ